MKPLNSFLVLFLSFFLSCSQKVNHPKPISFLRIDYPEKEYYSIDSLCPYQFEIPNYSAWVHKFKNNPPCSKAIIFPDLKAELLCEYQGLNENLNEHFESVRSVVFEHSFKSSAIIERLWKNDSLKVYGITYEIKGNTACNYAFCLTDSVQHFFFGQLLFQCRPNYDSLSPSIEFIKEDLEKLIESFKWEKSIN